MTSRPKLSVLIAALLAATSAAAQGADDKAVAEQLFLQARALASRGAYAEACPKFEASLKLDPALGTQLNLADCWEKTGRTASAWALYREAANLAARSHQRKRERIARERAAILEPRLPMLVVKVPAASFLPGLVITRNGIPVDAALFGTAMYVDPGEQEILATAPQHREHTAKVTAEPGRQVLVEIPALERLPTPPPDLDLRPVAPAPIEPGRGHRRLAVVGIVAGGVALGVGVGFGVSAKLAWDRAFDDGLCREDTRQCTAAGQDLTDRARVRATVSTVLVGAGALLVAGGVVLWLTAPRRSEKRSAGITPVVGAGGAGLVVSGEF